MAHSKPSPGCVWTSCPGCGHEREIPADPLGRGAQICSACGGEVVPPQADFDPGPPLELPPASSEEIGGCAYRGRADETPRGD